MKDLDFMSETIGLTEAAAFLHMSEDKLMDLARARKVPACKTGGRRWVFMRSLLMEYVRCLSLGEETSGTVNSRRAASECSVPPVSVSPGQRVKSLPSKSKMSIANASSAKTRRAIVAQFFSDY